MTWLSLIPVVINNTSAFVSVHDIRCLCFHLCTSSLYHVMMHVHEPYGRKCFGLFKCDNESVAGAENVENKTNVDSFVVF